MDDVTTQLSEAFEAAGYEVDDASENRGRIRVTLQEASPTATALREIVQEVCGEDDIMGFDVTSEATAGDESVGTVVSFRYRP